MAGYTDNYAWLESKFGNVMDAHQNLGQKLREAGPLSVKEGQLVQLAAAAVSRSEGAVHSHVRRAREAGASADEIYHALLLITSTAGFPSVAAALSWAREVIES